MPSASTGNALVTLLESDVLTSFGSALLSFLMALQAAKTDPIKVTAAWIQLQGNLAPALLQLEGTLASQALGALQAKLTAAIAAAQGAAPPTA